MERMVLRQGVKEIAGMFLFSGNFILASELFIICCDWKEFKFRNQEGNKTWETGAAGWMWVWDCGGFLSCLFSLLVKLVSTAGTWGRHCWEWWFRVFWPYGWFLLERPDAEIGRPSLMFIWGTERKSLLDFPLSCRSMNSIQLGPRGEREAMPNSSLISEPTPCQWQSNGRGFYPQATEEGKEIPAFGKGRL